MKTNRWISYHDLYIHYQWISHICNIDSKIIFKYDIRSERNLLRFLYELWIYNKWKTWRKYRFEYTGEHEAITASILQDMSTDHKRIHVNCVVGSKILFEYVILFEKNSLKQFHHEWIRYRWRHEICVVHCNIDSDMLYNSNSLLLVDCPMEKNIVHDKLRIRSFSNILFHLKQLVLVNFMTNDQTE